MPKICACGVKMRNALYDECSACRKAHGYGRHCITCGAILKTDKDRCHRCRAPELWAGYKREERRREIEQERQERRAALNIKPADPKPKPEPKTRCACGEVTSNHEKLCWKCQLDSMTEPTPQAEDHEINPAWLGLDKNVRRSVLAVCSSNDCEGWTIGRRADLVMTGCPDADEEKVVSVIRGVLKPVSEE